MEQVKVAKVREMMARKLVTLRPEMSALEAASVLLKRGVSVAPVVDGDGALLGLLSEFDCLKAVASSDYENDAHDQIETVGELMSRSPMTVSPELDLFGLAQEFVSRRVHRFPVVEGGRLIGQVSRRDALEAAVALRHELRRRRTGAAYPDYPQNRKPIRNYPSR